MASTDGAVNFSEVIMQAYNFDDPANFQGVNAAPYTAYWANADAVSASVPEPGTIALLLSGLAFIGFAGYRRRFPQS